MEPFQKYYTPEQLRELAGAPFFAKRRVGNAFQRRGTYETKDYMPGQLQELAERPDALGEEGMRQAEDDRKEVLAGIREDRENGADPEVHSRLPDAPVDIELVCAGPCRRGPPPDRKPLPPRTQEEKHS